MSAFTGRRRRRTTTRAVRVADRTSEAIITLGGLGTIVAVSTICLFLVWVVLPLFQSAELSSEGETTGLAFDLTAAPLAMGMDDQRLLAWALLADGQAVSFRLSDGEVLERRTVFPGELPTAVDVENDEGHLAAGFADGSVQFGQVSVAVEFLEGLATEDPTLAALEPGQVASLGDRLVLRTPAGQLRAHSLLVEMEEPVAGDGAAGVVLIDQSVGSSGSVAAILRDDGVLDLSRVRRRRNLLTGQVTTTLAQEQLPHEQRADGARPMALRITERGADVFVAWEDGLLRRYNTQAEGGPVLAETVQLVEAPARLTCLEFLVGRSTLVAGDTTGTVRGWFLARESQAGALALVAAHELAGPDSPVVSLGPSARTRSLVAGHADGSARVLHVTSGQTLAETRLEGGREPLAVALAPRDDGLLAMSSRGLQVFDLTSEHPETTFASLFLPVWYEGESGPTHIWQSTGGTDAFEPKLSLFPLIFGTLKATLYSMLFSVPLALLAAIYTSEFLVRKVRERVKQAIEMMATLPSVVLGFLAAIVLAPFIERSLPGVMAAFLVVPLVWLLGAQLWQLLPQERAIRWSGWPRLAVIALVVPLAVALAFRLGPLLEASFFAGDMRAWLDGQAGTPFGGWAFVSLPLCAVLAAWLSARYLTPLMRSMTAGWSRGSVALLDLARFVAVVLGALGMALLAAGVLDSFGLDPRTGPVAGSMNLAPTGTYVQRNALIVGFVMGFAVVPIIYTLAEDALSSVPDHLRAASLATGATPWQTAVRVVVPTAMSGLFSAVMIGLGRAVGETMVVLMAAGNTPILEANMFNGFRTLSANIAVELPEAVQGGSLYRVLFLSALTLFAMTFTLNTVAELVRMRFRKRAYEL